MFASKIAYSLIPNIDSLNIGFDDNDILAGGSNNKKVWPQEAAFSLADSDIRRPRGS